MFTAHSVSPEVKTVGKGKKNDEPRRGGPVYPQRWNENYLRKSPSTNLFIRKVET